MTNPIVQFIVIALIAAIFLWALSQFPTLDATIVKFVRIIVLVVLSIMALNLILLLLFHRGISGFLGS